MRYYITITAFLTINFCFSQTRLDTLLKTLQQEADYSEICRAKNEIKTFEKEAIPYLIKLLKDTASIQVINTADLIYPGAQKFYGHGSLLNYAINSIAVRAGWCLEEITFTDFGFKDRSVDENQLLKLHQNNYKKYLEKGYHDVDFQSHSKRTQLKIYRLILADSVYKWWEKNKNTWTTITALKNALTNNNKEMQDLAINYLSNCFCTNYSDKDQKEIKRLLSNLEKKRNVTLINPQLFSPYNLFITGEITNSKTGSPLEKALIEVFNRQAILIKKIFTDSLGQYSFGTSLHVPDKYIIKVSYPNYTHKIFSLSTENIPLQRQKSKFPSIQADLSISEKIEGVDYSALDKPINHYFYNSNYNNFTYDKQLLEASIKQIMEIKAAEKNAKSK